VRKDIVLLGLSETYNFLELYFWSTRFESVRQLRAVFPSLPLGVRFEVFTAVTMKNIAFWDVTLCGSYKNRRFGGAKFLRNVGSYKSHTA
jgi:hypothetical protein